MLNATQAADTLAARDKAVSKLRSLIQSGITTDADRVRERALLDEIARHDRAVMGAVGDAARSERERADNFANQARIGAGIMSPVGTFEKRSALSADILGVELRALDNAPHGDTFASTVLRGSDGTSKILPRVEVFEFDSSKGMIPVVPRATASLSAEGASLADIAVSGAVAPFDTVKVAALTTVERDDLEDYPFVDGALSDALAGAIGERIDVTLIAGGTDGENTVSGFVDVGVTTAPTGSLALADVLSAVARVTDAGGTANAVFMSAQGKAAFLAANAGKLAGLDIPEIVTIGKLDDGTAALDDSSFVVADLSKVAVALRKKVSVSMHYGEDALFAVDGVGLVGTARVSGVSVANAGHVQVVTGTAV